MVKPKPKPKVGRKPGSHLSFTQGEVDRLIRGVRAAAGGSPVVAVEVVTPDQTKFTVTLLRTPEAEAALARCNDEHREAH
jgi:hypothetical protein